MHRPILLLAATMALASAQEPEVNPPGTPVPPPPAAGINANPQAGALEAQVINTDQVFPKMTGDALADLYSKFTGRRVTVSVAASTAEFRFMQRAPLSYGEAAQLLKKAALLEGFVFVPDVNMENHDVLVVAPGTPAGPKDQGVKVIIDAADLPNDDQVVSYVMNLKFIKPDEIVRTFTTIVGQFSAYGSITPVPNAGAVVITEKTSLIRRLIELRDEIDVSAQVATKFIPVQFADVTELAETLNEILNTQQQSQASAGVQRVQNNPAPGAPAVATGGEGGNAGESVPIQIFPDSRTNRIFAMGRPVDIVFIEGLVREFDSQTSERNYLRRKLSFVPVIDFLDVAEQALVRAFSGAATAGGGAAGGGGNFGNNRTTGGARAGNTNQANANAGGNALGGAGGGGDSFGQSGNVLDTPNIDTAPVARLVGRTLLVADNITNSLVVQGPPSSLEIINSLLDEIDVKADQVMISAIFGQLALTDQLSFGVDYVRTLSGNQDGAFAGRGGSGDFPLVPLEGGIPFVPGTLPSGSALNMYGRIGENFNILVNALQSDENFQVLSRPTIFCANNQKGVISAGQRIAVPTSSSNFGTGNGGISTNIEYQNVLLSLEVVPLVNSPEEVTLQIALLNDEVIGTQEIEGVGSVPTIGRRQVLTNVTVPNNSTIVLGGLITTRKRDSVSGIPLLSDIPGLGKLFSTTTTTDERQELMIFIQPRIVTGPSTMYDAQVDMDSRYQVAEDSLDFAQSPVDQYPPAARPVADSKGGEAPPVAVPVQEERQPRRAFGRPGSPFRSP